MSSVCISNCINDARDPRVPVRATYVNLHKWPESEAEFLRSVQRGEGPRVVDSISFRQMYLRSYTFSREEDHHEGETEKEEKTQRCFGLINKTTPYPQKETDENDGDLMVDVLKRRRLNKRTKGKSSNKKKGFGMRRMKDVCCSGLFRFFHSLLSCAATVDVVDQKDN